MLPKPSSGSCPIGAFPSLAVSGASAVTILRRSGRRPTSVLFGRQASASRRATSSGGRLRDRRGLAVSLRVPA
eukprot:5156626-Pyramimonas_sp.AAC.1